MRIKGGRKGGFHFPARGATEGGVDGVGNMATGIGQLKTRGNEYGCHATETIGKIKRKRGDNPDLCVRWR